MMRGKSGCAVCQRTESYGEYDSEERNYAPWGVVRGGSRWIRTITYGSIAATARHLSFRPVWSSAVSRAAARGRVTRYVV